MKNSTRLLFRCTVSFDLLFILILTPQTICPQTMTQYFMLNIISIHINNKTYLFNKDSQLCPYTLFYKKACC